MQRRLRVLPSQHHFHDRVSIEHHFAGLAAETIFMFSDLACPPCGGVGEREMWQQMSSYMETPRRRSKGSGFEDVLRPTPVIPRADSEDK
jgi:hypothetical protein